MFYLSLFSLSRNDMISMLVIGGVFAWVAALVIGLGYLKRRDIRWRATLEPLCEWEYSAADWPQIAEKYELAFIPKGAASVRITKLDIWITDENRERRNELDGDRRCVTGCIYENGMFKIRIRSWAILTRGGSVTYTTVDLKLPVPAGHEQAAQTAAAYFIETISKQTEKIATVIPDGTPLNIFGETGL